MVFLDTKPPNMVKYYIIFTFCSDIIENDRTDFSRIGTQDANPVNLPTWLIGHFYSSKMTLLGLISNHNTP